MVSISAGVALVFGLLIGSAGEPEPVTKTVTKVIEKKVEGPVPVTCIKALDKAEAIITGPAANMVGYGGEWAGIASDILAAWMENDVTMLDGMDEKMISINNSSGKDAKELDRLIPQYNNYSDACRKS